MFNHSSVFKFQGVWLHWIIKMTRAKYSTNLKFGIFFSMYYSERLSQWEKNYFIPLLMCVQRDKRRKVEGETGQKDEIH